MATRYYPSTALLPIDPLAPSRLERNRIDRAAARFELTEAEYRNAAVKEPVYREFALRDRLRQFDDNRRPPFDACRDAMFWAAWDADYEANMARAWAAFERAGERFSRSAAA